MRPWREGESSTQTQRIRNFIEDKVVGKRGRGRTKKPYLEKIKYVMPIGKQCGVKDLCDYKYCL